MKASARSSVIRWFADLSLSDAPEVGGKSAALGEMVRDLMPHGVKVPPGFAITAEAYRKHLRENQLQAPIHDALSGLDTTNVSDLARRAAHIRNLITDAPLPPSIAAEIGVAYEELGRAGGVMPAVAVRSSATSEDSAEASFAGQQDSFLNVQGRVPLLQAVKQCFASLFNDRAISYRVDRAYDHEQMALAVAVQQMVRSDLAAAGVMFTLDTETGMRNVVLINASYGLGEAVVQGTVNPDEIYVFKPTLRLGKDAIIQRRIGNKEVKIVYDDAGGMGTQVLRVPEAQRRLPAITDAEALALARTADLIEQHFTRRHGVYTPMDIEWAKDGLTGELFIVQARPETVKARVDVCKLTVYKLDEKAQAGATVLATGTPVGDRIGVGAARVIRDVKDLDRLRPGEVLITTRTDPDWEPSMKSAAAIVTERGGRTCHAAIVSRELGIPAIVGVEAATQVLPDGGDLTVSCASGSAGRIFEGRLPYRQQVLDTTADQPAFTNLMLNIGNPAEALALSMLPNDGVGLARMEFLITSAIKIHPMALVRFDQLRPGAERDQIAALTVGYDRKADYFVDRLAEGIAMIGAAFYPKDVIVRFSDFKTNEYASLLGGKEFEPLEENPMLGFRGASRYYDPRYREAFALECAAVQRVRSDMGLTNVKVMVPFCRTVEEAKKVLAEMAAAGLVRGRDGLEIYVMCEIPSNVLLAKEFAAHFDGFSIGSNDLTQLVLGVDRDSESVAHLFDERNPAVTKMIREAIDAVHTAGRKIGICGQAPSDYPEFTTMLVELGIDSISLNPDALLKTRRMVATLVDTVHDR